jgi:hypothetical protein
MDKYAETAAPRPLDPLVSVLCDIEDRGGMTPVLVSDPRLVLADEFYVGLCTAVAERSGRPVRLDLLPGHRLACHAGAMTRLGRWATAPWLPASAASAIFSPMRRRFIKRLAKRLPEQSRIESTAAVSRPGGPLRELVIGLAGPGDELPPFAQEISLGIDFSSGPE